MRKKPPKFINLQHIYAVMFIPALKAEVASGLEIL